MLSTRTLLPAGLLLVLWVAFAIFATLANQDLPERVATHFGSHGQPGGWMTRVGYRRTIMAFAILFPLSFVGIFSALRWVPSRFIGIPNREFYLAGDERSASLRFLIRHGLWFACLSVLFVAAVHASIVDANRTDPPHLRNSWILGAVGGYVLSTILWCVVLHRRFCRPTTSS